MNPDPKMRIEFSTDYYPSGQPMPERNFNEVDYRFGFNGKEKDNEVSGSDGTHLDFGFREYDSRIGRWWSSDPLEKKYPNMSPYNFVANNPIISKDKEGKDIYVVIWASANGEVGHAAIAVSNYKAIETKSIENGKEITKTEWVPDGTFTFYELAPAPPGVGKTNFDENVQASYGGKSVTWNDIFHNPDVSGCDEKRPSEGVIKFETDFATDQKAKAKLYDIAQSKKPYNGKSNNCSDYVEAGLEAALSVDIKADEALPSYSVIKSLINKQPTYNFELVTTPNQLYKSISKLPGAKVLKSPGTKVNTPFIEGATNGDYTKGVDAW